MNQAIALELDAPLDSGGLPAPAAWEKVSPVAFCSDWRGRNPDPQRETRARLLWSREFLFLQFACRYRELHVYEGGNCRRDRLWEKDAAEVFLQPPGNELRHYLEFEIGPNGDWLDLDIAPGRKSILYCDMKSRVAIDPGAGAWTAEMAIPMRSLAAGFNPAAAWRFNLFRIEGKEPGRFYSAWQPTHTPRPNFHVPEVFGELLFQ